MSRYVSHQLKRGYISSPTKKSWIQWMPEFTNPWKYFMDSPKPWEEPSHCGSSFRRACDSSKGSSRPSASPSSRRSADSTWERDLHGKMVENHGKTRDKHGKTREKQGETWENWVVKRENQGLERSKVLLNMGKTREKHGETLEQSVKKSGK